MKKRMLIILFVVAVTAGLCGCEGMKEKVFQTQKEVVMKEYKKDQLKSNTFYVKDGTSFFKTVSLKGGKDRNELDFHIGYLWFPETQLDYIPTLYKGESIAYPKETSVKEDSFYLKRYRDEGVTLGISNLKKASNGFTIQSILEDSAASKTIESSKSLPVISRFQGEPLNDKKMTTAGTIKGLESGETYLLEIYQGTRAMDVQLVADTQLFIIDSARMIENCKLTKNGYVSVQLPEDMESGYYQIENAGFFRYINEEKYKFSQDLNTVDYNVGCKEIPQSFVSYAVGTGERPKTEAELLEKEVSYSEDIGEELQSLDIEVSLKRGVTPDSIKSVTLIYPDGKKEVLETENPKIYQKELTSVPAGKYVIKVQGTQIENKNIGVVFMKGDPVINVADEGETETEDETQTDVQAEDQTETEEPIPPREEQPIDDENRGDPATDFPETASGGNGDSRSSRNSNSENTSGGYSTDSTTIVDGGSYSTTVTTTTTIYYDQDGNVIESEVVVEEDGTGSSNETIRSESGEHFTEPVKSGTMPAPKRK